LKYICASGQNFFSGFKKNFEKKILKKFFEKKNFFKIFSRPGNFFSASGHFQSLIYIKPF